MRASRFKINKFEVMIVFVILALWGLRTINMDVDIPGYEVAAYMPLDEGYYAMDAIRISRPEIQQVIQTIDDTEIDTWDTSVSLATTIFTLITMGTFGNNYYGIRMAAFLAGTIVLILFIRILYQENIDKKTKIIMYGFILTSFSFFMACRVLEPSIFRMMMSMFIIWIYYEMNRKGEIKEWILGGLAIFSVTIGYPTNLFAPISCGVMIILECFLFENKFWRKLGSYIAGVLGGYIISEILNYCVHGRFFIQDFTRVVLKKEISRVGLSLGRIKDGFWSYMEGKSFIYCWVLLTLVAIAVAFCFYSGWIKKERFRLFVGIMIMMHGIQTVLTNDFAERKSIVIFPILLLAIMILLKDREWLRGEVKKLDKKTIIAIKLSILLFSIISCAIAINKLLRISPQFLPNEYKYTILCFNFIGIIFLYIAIIYEEKIWVKYFVSVAMMLAFIPGIVMQTYGIFEMDYTEKEAMIELQELVGNEAVLGGFPMAYSLYNEIIPLSSTYDGYMLEQWEKRSKQLAAKEEVRFYLGYQNEELLSKWIDETKYKWILVKQMRTEFGFSDRIEAENDVFLYEKVKR